MVGDDIEDEIRLGANHIATFDNVELEKGDELVIWTKVSTALYEDDEVFHKKIKYHIEKEGKTLVFDSFSPFHYRHIIRSKKEGKESKTNEYDNEQEEWIDVITPYTQWEFEAESIVYEVPENGVYVFDFKPASSGSDYDSYTVILRKR